MVARSSAAPPTPWSKDLAQPKIHETAYVHSFSNIIGDVYVGANVLIAPGTSIRADEGSPFHVGDGSNVQDGVVIHGLEQGRVIGDDQQQYSVWIGKNTSITHMALIHGPAYVGDDCFIGFRSTIFNARVGKGCIVMMHVLIQDVEIPPGKYVPSGSVITLQQQADRLPDVQSVDVKFANHVVGVNDALRSGYHCAENVSCISTVRSELEKVYESSSVDESNPSNQSSYYRQGQSNSMGSDVVDQVRQLLSQGYRIGTEHADARRFQTSSWKSCAPIQSMRESDVIAELQSCMAEHSGEYVRVFGIDTKSKRRVSEMIVQRPGDKPAANQSFASASVSRSAGSVSSPSYSAPAGGSNLGTEAIEQVRSLLSQGYKIGAEHADARRFQTSSWKSCTPIQSTRESDVIAALEACLAENSGEYVRVFGIDTKSKRRVAELTIQRPGSRTNGTAASVNAAPAPTFNTSNTNSGYRPAPSGGKQLDQQTVEQVRSLLSQGYKIGTEHANRRRFQTSSWETCSPIAASRESEVFAALESCLAEHRGEYVRLFGIDTKSKRRVSDLIIQRP